MDLTIKLEETYLNIRVAVILETQKGFLLEKNKKGFYFFAGGRVKIGESSLQAAIRETQEETGLILNSEDFEFVSTIENFYKQEFSVQEICFVYKINKIFNLENLNDFNLMDFTKEQMRNMDIRPEIIKSLILENKINTITHFIV